MKRTILIALLMGVLTSTESVMAGELTLDDFSNSDGRTSVGTEWEGFTDRVMGGRSDVTVRIVNEEGTRYLHMEGQVSLENNGGFIQVRLPLAPNGDDFDASEYSGIRIRYRTPRPGSYFLHLRTRRTRLPWAHFAAALPEASAWSEERVPWSAFEKQLTLLRQPDPAVLTSVAVVAGKEAFSAAIDVGYIGLY